MTDRGQMTEGALARRLYELEVSGAERLVDLAHGESGGRHRSTSGSRGRRRTLIGGGLLAAVLVLAVAATPLVQAAVSPIGALLQRQSGVTSRALTAVPARPGSATRVTSAGHTITLLGAYGDQFHTVVYLRADGYLGVSDLRDESGRAIPAGGSQGVSDGSIALQFDPISTGRHELRLHFTSLFLPKAGVVRGLDAGETVHGDWTFQIPLDVRVAATFVPSPGSGNLGAVRADIVKVGGDADVVYVDVQTTGATFDELQDDAHTGNERTSLPGPGQFRIQVLDPRGHALASLGQIGAEGGGSKAASQPRIVSWNASWKAVGPGTYQVVLTYRGHALRSTFTIS
jgi:hypothetical protein